MSATRKDRVEEEQKGLPLWKKVALFLGGGSAGGGYALGELERNAMTDWGPLLLKGGAAFVIAFVVARLVRRFVMKSLVVIALLAIVGAALVQFETLGIDWHELHAHVLAFVSSLPEDFASVAAFREGNAGSTGTAAAGLLAGFTGK